MRLIIFLSISCLLSCSVEQNNKSVKKYFDTKSYFEQEIKSLSAKGFWIEKEMTFNNKTEKIKTDSVNWKKEMNPFLLIDLCKPSNIGRYSLDSTFINEKRIKLTYRTEDTKADIQLVEIEYNEKQTVHSIHILLRDKNTIYESETSLVYFTDSAFSIIGKQHIKYTEGITYKVNVSLFKN